MTDAEPTNAFRAPRQHRSQVTLDKMLDAAERLAARDGPDGLALGDIAAEAGITIGAIYRRFADKRSLFLAVQDRCLTRLATEATATIDHATKDPAVTDLPASVALATSILVGGARRHEGLFRTFVVGGATDPEVQARGARFNHHLAVLYRQLLWPHLDEITHAEPAVAVDITFRIVQATLEQRLQSGPTFTTPMRHSWRRLQDELTTACLAYLRMPP